MHTAEHFTHLLRERGLRITAQRLTIFRVMQEHGRHLTAEEVFDRVREVLPTISLTTVYKILNELVELGELQRVALGDASTRFDPNTARHAHLVCTRCGQTEDLPSTDFHVGMPAVAARGYLVQEQAVVFFGLCPACHTSAPSTSS